MNSSAGKVSFYSLFFPLIFELVMNNILSTVNTAVLSGYSESASTAVGAATPLISLLLLFGSTLSTGSAVLISNSIGAGDKKRSGEICFTGLLTIVLIVALISPILIIFAPEIMVMQNLTGEIGAMATTYFRIRVGSIVVTSLSSALLAVMRCYGYAKYTFLSGFVTGAINLVLNIFVVFLFKPSPMGSVAGAAFSCVAATVCSLILLIILFIKKKIAIKLTKSIRSFIRYNAAILKIGLPSALSGGSFTLSQIVTTSFMAELGNVALSAKVYFTNILSYAYAFSFAAGSANSIMTGIRFGARELECADKMNKKLIRLTSVFNLAVSLAILLLHRPLVSVFTDTEAIISLSVGVFLVDTLTEHGRAISHIYEYSLRSIRDVWFSMLAMIISCWTFSIALSYILSIKLGLGLIGCYIGLAADELTRGLVTRLRWNCKYKKYKKIKAPG